MILSCINTPQDTGQDSETSIPPYNMFNNQIQAQGNAVVVFMLRISILGGKYPPKIINKARTKISTLTIFFYFNLPGMVLVL